MGYLFGSHEKEKIIYRDPKPTCYNNFDMYKKCIDNNEDSELCKQYKINYEECMK